MCCLGKEILCRRKARQRRVCLLAEAAEVDAVGDIIGRRSRF